MAAYQVLDDSWQKTISIDLETIQAEGHDAVRKVDANMVVKKKGGKDVEVPDGWVGYSAVRSCAKQTAYC